MFLNLTENICQAQNSWIAAFPQSLGFFSSSITYAIVKIYFAQIAFLPHYAILLS